MSFSPELAETAVAEHPRRRLHPRYALRSLAYVKLEQANGAIIRDLTESGVAIQALLRLRLRKSLLFASICFRRGYASRPAVASSGPI